MMFKKQKQNSVLAAIGSCTRAFARCQDDAECRPRLTAMLAACQAGDDVIDTPTTQDARAENEFDDEDDSDGDGASTASSSTDVWRSRCNRHQCLRAVREFYDSGARWHQSAEHLLMCRCDEDDDDVASCDAVRRSLMPSCARVELPPPTCLDLVRRCTDDQDCGDRWKNYERRCWSSDVMTGSCPDARMCREAMIGLAGTELTTNCTCAVSDPGQLRLCIELRRRIQQSNACTVSAIDDFMTSLVAMTTPPPMTSSQRQSSPLSGYSSDDAYHHDDDDNNQHPDCLRHYSLNKIPLYMTIPSVIRIYRNESGCSEICSCRRGEKTVVCRALPCGTNMSCKLRDVVYVHGASFMLAARGHCRCINGEIVCAKAHHTSLPQHAGLFLHVGYSVVDQQLVERHSSVRMRPESVAVKLGTLLNEDSAAQFCTVTVRGVSDGNIVFNITVSKYNTRVLNDLPEDCVQPAKTLSYMINSRHAAVISDVEMSVLKVSLLERVQLHEPVAPPTEPPMTSSSLQPSWTDHMPPYSVLFNPASLSSSSAPASSRERKGAAQLAAPVLSSSPAANGAIWRMTLSCRLLLFALVVVRLGEGGGPVADFG